MPSAVLRSLRPKQWTKNGLLFFGLIFSFNLFHVQTLLTVLAAFGVFCALSSATYLINDLADIEKDRQHPTKRNRPLASGALKPVVAVWASAVLAISGLTAAFLLSIPFGCVGAGYLILMLLYSVGLKHVVIIDVFVVASGFVIRAVAGAVVIAVPISPWLYACTILGSLLIALGKRRHELLLLEDDATKHRRILEEYTPAMLDQMITIVSASALMAYSLYTFTAENLPRNNAMMVTIPLVLYGLFRYLNLVHLRDAGGSPEEMLLSDWPLAADVLLWVTTSGLILYLF